MGKVIILFLMSIIVGCASGHCRGVKTESRVRVYKPDGTKQCSDAKAISLDDMAKELKDIKVYAQENKALSDTAMIMLCGADTGRVNIYEISEGDLNRALALGFKGLKNE